VLYLLSCVQPTDDASGVSKIRIENFIYYIVT